MFWFGLVLQIVFAIGLGWLPSSGRTTLGGGDFVDHVQHLLLPATVLAVVQAAAWSRYLRGSMIETLAQPFMLAARARGIPARAVILRHALRNALGPVLAIVLLDAALLVSGAVVTESVFAWPGLGSLFTEALARRDYTVLMALLMLTSTAIVVFNIVGRRARTRCVDPRVAASHDARAGAAARCAWSRRRSPRRRSRRTRRINSTSRIAAKRRRWRTGSAPTSSAATCSHACCTARASRWRSVCCRPPSPARLASRSAASPAMPAARSTRC